MLCCLSLITRLCKLIVLRSSNYHVRSTFFFFLMIRRPPRSTLSSSSAASDVYKRQVVLTGAKERSQTYQAFEKIYPVLNAVSYTHLRAHETPEHLVCRLLLEKKKKKKKKL
eukprot:TRINITY_DN17683_c0_g1_i5.p1 TRINITY_DN17683_c0_g1~~TRINITY_DN17683_c0_g1_i5.p1  ORF type:complete len:112 (+),score=41.55 TRINITY_DN17683_c0_g1_i5:30-365(+)